MKKTIQYPTIVQRIGKLLARNNADPYDDGLYNKKRKKEAHRYERMLAKRILMNFLNK